MKKIIVVCMCLAAVGCEKKRCYECTAVDNNGITVPNIYTTSYCGWTESDKQEHEKSNTHPFGNGGYIKTNCIAK